MTVIETSGTGVARKALVTWSSSTTVVMLAGSSRTAERRGAGERHSEGGRCGEPRKERAGKGEFILTEE